MGHDQSLAAIRARIIGCERCTRLREYCRRIGREKRAAYRQDMYWAKPVPGFGDPAARIALVGLAPAAHGANRTGRNFTGDGVGGSGDFLMAALFANGLANQPFSRDANDGLTLRDAWIAAAVRCAPPDNKPTPAEIANCTSHLHDELAALPNLCVYVALGRIAFDACRRLIAERHGALQPKPFFEHGAVFRVIGPASPKRLAKAGPAFAERFGEAGPVLVASYHPSRQNTNTGRLTPAMLRSAFRRAVSEAARRQL